MSPQPPREVLNHGERRLFASVLRLLDASARHVTVVDPDHQAAYDSGYDVAVVSERPAPAHLGGAVIWLPHPEQDRPAGTLRVGPQHETVPVTSAADLVALINRAGTACQKGRG